MEKTRPVSHNDKIYQATHDKVVDWEVKSKPTSLPYDAINSQIRFLMGKVLTVVDASYQEGEQKRAVKNLIKDKFSEQLSWIYELCGYPEAQQISEMPDNENNIIMMKGVKGSSRVGGTE